MASPESICILYQPTSLLVYLSASLNDPTFPMQTVQRYDLKSLPSFPHPWAPESTIVHRIDIQSGLNWTRMILWMLSFVP